MSLLDPVNNRNFLDCFSQPLLPISKPKKIFLAIFCGTMGLGICLTSFGWSPLLAIGIAGIINVTALCVLFKKRKIRGIDQEQASHREIPATSAPIRVGTRDGAERVNESDSKRESASPASPVSSRSIDPSSASAGSLHRIHPVDERELIESQRDIPLPIPPPGLLGPEPIGALRTIQMRVNDVQGTPGVNFPGTDLIDRQNVLKRIEMVRTYIMPHAHDRESKERFDVLIMSLTNLAIGVSPPFSTFIEAHLKNKTQMIARYGRQLRATVLGLGPIGLEASLILFKLGYHVAGYEQYLEKQDKEEAESKLRAFDVRRQPFSLIRQSFWLLSANGLDSEELIKEYGLTSPDPGSDEIQNRFGTVGAWVFKQISTHALSDARKARIGAHAVGYVPNAMSIKTGGLQRLLLGVVKRIEESENKEVQTAIGLHFGMKCSQIEKMENNRHQLIFETHVVRDTDTDLIINATGGRIHPLLQKHVAKMHGMGVFFAPPKAPVHKTTPPILSRAVRPFCSFKPKEEIYVNMELFPKEFDDASKREELIDILAEDMGLPPHPREHFTVEIDLSHSTQPIIKSETPPAEIPQFVINVGDSVLKPHFITASGANFGLLLLSGLTYLFTRLNKGEITPEQLTKEYSEMCNLMQRQSYQIVTNLFARPFPRS